MMYALILNYLMLGQTLTSDAPYAVSGQTILVLIDTCRENYTCDGITQPPSRCVVP